MLSYHRSRRVKVVEETRCARREAYFPPCTPIGPIPPVQREGRIGADGQYHPAVGDPRRSQLSPPRPSQVGPRDEPRAQDWPPPRPPVEDDDEGEKKALHPGEWPKEYGGRDRNTVQPEEREPRERGGRHESKQV